jgi:hypothetical protein
MTAGSTVRIFSVDGRWVQTLTADSNGIAHWTRTNSSGDSVASGIYLYLVTDAMGSKAHGKLVIIR